MLHGIPFEKGGRSDGTKESRTSMELSELSKKRLEGVDERLKAVVMECAARCRFPFNVSEGLRSEAKQREYVKQGKSRTMKSKHLVGKAVDLYPLTMNRKEVDWSRFEDLAEVMFDVAKEMEVEIIWGGHWKTFVDKCHFELK